MCAVALRLELQFPVCFDLGDCVRVCFCVTYMLWFDLCNLSCRVLLMLQIFKKEPFFHGHDNYDQVCLECDHRLPH